VFESAALGSAILQVTALDKDKGDNAELIYTIESGENYRPAQSWCDAWHLTPYSLFTM
jgi:hypothetical protein